MNSRRKKKATGSDAGYSGEVALKLTLNRRGWHAVLDAHPKEE